MIFTLINSVNKACRGRIYTHDYIGLRKKKRGGEKEEAGEEGGNKEGGGEAGGDVGREQAAWWRRT